MIGVNTVVHFQMKAHEMRGQLNTMGKRSSEAFNLSH